MNKLPHSACWSAADAERILHVGALGADKQSFLATHLPIEGFSVLGPEARGIAEPTERDLLQNLSRPERRHAFCVVEGEPGSGKSHLIRWLKVVWPWQQDDLVLLIQRLDGSLQGTLEELRKNLPERHRGLFKHVGRANGWSLEGQTRNFQSMLVNAMRSGALAAPLPDNDWCEKHQLAVWLRHPALDKWPALARIMEKMSGAGGTRDQTLARFHLDDIAELEQILGPYKAPGTGMPLLRLSRELKKEAEVIRALTDVEKSHTSVHERLRSELPHSHKLLDALNLRRNDAVQNVLGISPQALKQLFGELRRLLAPRRLVLLLEDITAWEGIDNQLIDVLVTNADENPELCPMISVVGLTPDYLHAQGFRANYQQRIGLHVRLGDEEDGSQIQQVSTLRSTDAQVRFVANYLRAARAGQQALGEWDGDPATLPNACSKCPVRDGCHGAFGEAEGIGLFPFNHRAVEQLYLALTASDRRSTLHTPRGMIQGVLAPTLLAPHDIEAGNYPDQRLLSAYIPPDQQRLPGNARDIIGARATDTASRERLTRLVRFWGSSQISDLKTTRDPASDELSFAGMPRALFDALGAPWPGDDQGEPAPTPGQQAPATGAKDPTEPEPKPTAEPGAKHSETITKPKKAAASKKQAPAALLRQVEEINSWEHGEPPADRQGLNRIASEVIDLLPWGRLGVPQWLRRRLFTPDMVLLQGTGQERQHLVLPRERWVARGLAAYAELRGRGDDLDADEANSYQRAYARMQTQLMKLVRRHVDERMPRLADGSPWDSAVTATQILFARALLRGAVAPEADAVEHWRTLVGPEDEASSDPKERVPSWGETLEKTRGSHSKIREVLLALINCPQDIAKTETSVVNPGACAEALLAMRADLKLAGFPAHLKTPGKALAELDKVSQCAGEVAERLHHLPGREAERLRQRAREVNTLLRGGSFYARVDRLDQAITAVADKLQQAAPEAVRSWRRIHEGMKTRGLIDPDAAQLRNDLEDFVDDVVSPDPPQNDESPLALLAWALQAPATDLAVAFAALRTGEQTVADLLGFLENFILETGTDGSSLSAIHAAGHRILNASTKAMSVLEESP